MHSPFTRLQPALAHTDPSAFHVTHFHRPSRLPGYLLNHCVRLVASTYCRPFFEFALRNLLCRNSVPGRLPAVICPRVFRVSSQERFAYTHLLHNLLQVQLDLLAACFCRCWLRSASSCSSAHHFITLSCNFDLIDLLLLCVHVLGAILQSSQPCI